MQDNVIQIRQLIVAFVEKYYKADNVKVETYNGSKVFVRFHANNACCVTLRTNLTDFHNYTAYVDGWYRFRVKFEIDVVKIADTEDAIAISRCLSQAVDLYNSLQENFEHTVVSTKNQ